MLNTRGIARLVTAALVVTALSATIAAAQSPLGIGTAEPAFKTTGFLGGFFAWINMEQQGFYRLMTNALKGMRENPWQLWSLVGLSFTYGVLHAAGPGHGKAVISSYMIANETELKRGVLLSFLSSLLQGVVAILLIGAVYLILRGTSISMTSATRWLEIASYALIAAFGGWLLLRKLRQMLRPVALASVAGGGHVQLADDHHHDHHDHHHSHHHDHHGHSHGPGEVCSSCGHAHAPDPSMLKGDRFALREAWSAVIAVGLRPCSGALIVLSFALLNGLYLGGVLSVFAMSIGTAITVSILATMAVTAKGVALRYAANGAAAARISNGIEIAGAALVLLLGLALLGAALQS
ncbi:MULTISPECIES: nickel/cobalt transporter [Ensifer]|uniref:Nickel/cobalt efflux system n=1 Tax=Ensifer adhaerens TaxID=106592 RepID=A0ABY8HD44_ENSAD|nr:MULTISPECIES: nickel/cobalt transporter [Ensifer]ANK73926.1 delayed-early response protein/equilibrative nucleoside transporter [Ensifer adhaerens]KDP76692.1 delayed-early response protein/equilibrative nucleoside transporter [Ensifer adhaerens]KQX02648.1 delayed-early response protein/equilibrative nucleoside transporter [Ensifer sp. Root423]KQZ39377.1 delayed-early response protein/equilibrative nucleoside transporter [Ensifer sp. Root558]MBD9543178.1 nickel/cobalt transporter [Ensifer sp